MPPLSKSYFCQQNGTLKIIDRKKHIFKLAQGEYIAPEKIENVYLRCEAIAQVFVHGESLQVSIFQVILKMNAKGDSSEVFLSSFSSPQILGLIFNFLL